MVELEKAGVPTVSFTARAYANDARASAQAFGLPAAPIAVVDLPFTNQKVDEIRRAVERMVAVSRLAPDGVVVKGLYPGLGVATVQKIAINAVMAGCLPEYLPVLVAAVQAVAEPKFMLRLAAMSTGPHAPLLLLNGPIVERLAINCGGGALGPSSKNRANVTIGRALRLVYMNIGHAYTGVMDMDTIGSANKFSLCVGENEAASPWAPFHVDRGFARDTSTLTALTVYASSDLFDFYNTTPEGILDTVAMCARNPAIASTGRWLEGGWAVPQTKEKILERNLVMLCPEHADIVGRAGWSKADVRQYLYDRATMSFRELRANREPSTLLAGRPDLQWLARQPDTQLPVVELPESYEICVVGGAAGRSMYFWGAHDSITRPIEE